MHKVSFIKFAKPRSSTHIHHHHSTVKTVLKTQKQFHTLGFTVTNIITKQTSTNINYTSNKTIRVL